MSIIELEEVMNNLAPRVMTFKDSIIMLGKLILDDDFVAGQNLVLVDSISLKPISKPSRGLGCKHVQCFDFDVYLMINKAKLLSEYSCPFCNQVCNPSKVYVDLIFVCLLELFPIEAKFNLNDKGYLEVITAGASSASKDVICIDMSSSDDDDGDEELFKTHKRVKKKPGLSVTMSNHRSLSIKDELRTDRVFLQDLSQMVQYLTSMGSKRQLSDKFISIEDLTRVSLDDILHLMNRETAWGIDSIPGLSTDMQVDLKNKRPFNSTTHQGLKHCLQLVRGVGTQKADNIIMHFSNILQNKLNAFQSFIIYKSAFTNIKSATTVASDNSSLSTDKLSDYIHDKLATDTPTRGYKQITATTTETPDNVPSRSSNKPVLDATIHSPNKTMSHAISHSPNKTVSDATIYSPNRTMSDATIYSPNRTVSDAISHSPNKTMSHAISHSPNRTVSDAISNSPNRTVSDAISHRKVEAAEHLVVAVDSGSDSNSRLNNRQKKSKKRGPPLHFPSAVDDDDDAATGGGGGGDQSYPRTTTSQPSIAYDTVGLQFVSTDAELINRRKHRPAYIANSIVDVFYKPNFSKKGPSLHPPRSEAVDAVVEISHGRLRDSSGSGKIRRNQFNTTSKELLQVSTTSSSSSSSSSEATAGNASHPCAEEEISATRRGVHRDGKAKKRRLPEDEPVQSDEVVVTTTHRPPKNRTGDKGNRGGVVSEHKRSSSDAIASSSVDNSILVPSVSSAVVIDDAPPRPLPSPAKTTSSMSTVAVAAVPSHPNYQQQSTAAAVALQMDNSYTDVGDVYRRSESPSSYDRSRSHSSASRPTFLHRDRTGGGDCFHSSSSNASYTQNTYIVNNYHNINHFGPGGFNAPVYHPPSPMNDDHDRMNSKRKKRQQNDDPRLDGDHHFHPNYNASISNNNNKNNNNNNYNNSNTSNSKNNNNSNKNNINHNHHSSSKVSSDIRPSGRSDSQSHRPTDTAPELVRDAPPDSSSISSSHRVKHHPPPQSQKSRPGTSTHREADNQLTCSSESSSGPSSVSRGAEMSRASSSSTVNSGTQLVTFRPTLPAVTNSTIQLSATASSSSQHTGARAFNVSRACQSMMSTGQPNYGSISNKSNSFYRMQFRPNYDAKAAAAISSSSSSSVKGVLLLHNNNNKNNSNNNNKGNGALQISSGGGSSGEGSKASAEHFVKDFTADMAN